MAYIRGKDIVRRKYPEHDLRRRYPKVFWTSVGISCALHLLRRTLDLHPEKLKFQDKMFDLLAGQPGLRSGLLRGVPVEQTVSSWQAGLESFRERRARHLIYPEDQSTIKPGI